MPAIRSGRSSRPKISSLTSIEPAAEPSIEVMSTLITSFSLRRFGGRRLGDGAIGVHTELAGHRRLLRQRLLHRVANRDPGAGVARHRSLDRDEAALDVGAHDA